MPGSFFCFGLGYSAAVLARRLLAEGWRVGGTARSEEQCEALRGQGIAAVPFERGRPIDPALLDGVTHLLSSVPPSAEGDSVLDEHFGDIARCPSLTWIGYLSTTGVYGDWRGVWVDEESPLRPSHDRAWRRVAAEQHWQDLKRLHDRPVHIFRLAGIYGPGRSILNDVRANTVERIVRKRQMFGRIHVEDIATVLRASMDRPNPGTVYNVCDDLPASPSDVAAYACELLGVSPPPEVPFEVAREGMSAMQLSFWMDSKKVRNDRIKQELGVLLAYPDYRVGLAAVLAAERAAKAG
jgi:nucleoside-diphosphate-sugar epimerase